jgi:uncharacterized protein (TIGR03067 family)
MIEGTYKLIRGEQNGEAEPEEDIDRSRLEIDGNRHIVTIGDAVLEGAHTLDTSQTPMEIDALDTVGPFQGMSVKGIFKLEKDVLTVCFAAPDQPRPTKFTTTDGAGTMMHVWRRQQ